MGQYIVFTIKQKAIKLCSLQNNSQVQTTLGQYIVYFKEQ